MFDWKNWFIYWDIDSFGDNVFFEEILGIDGEVKCFLYYVGDKRYENVFGFIRF